MANPDVLGIDLGTTYSSCCVYFNGQPVVVSNPSDSQQTTRSCVTFTDNVVLVGKPALTASAKPENQGRYVYDAKRMLGQTYQQVLENARTLPFSIVSDENGMPLIEIPSQPVRRIKPEEVSAEVLKRMRVIAHGHTGIDYRRAVITVPAYFNNTQREATIEAGRLAGLQVERIINEPTAAALAYSMTTNGRRRNAIVYDFGGGTLDVTVMTIERDVTVLATAGDVTLGGRDIDQNLFNHFVSEYRTATGTDITRNRRHIIEMTNMCEDIKKYLTENLQYSNLEDESFGAAFDFTLTRARFDSLNEAIFNRCLGPVERALRDARLSPSDIQDIVMVGGSSRIPKVRELVARHFGNRTLMSAINPDHAIAIGAAMEASRMSRVAGLSLPTIAADVTALSLGIRLQSGLTDFLLPRNTRTPATVTKEFETAEDNQTKVTVSICQGEKPFFSINHSLGSFVIEGLPAQSKGTIKLAITFSLDENTVLTVTAAVVGNPALSGRLVIHQLGSTEQGGEQLVPRNQPNMGAQFNRVAGLSLIENVELDKYMNPVGSSFDLIQDASMQRYTVAIVTFYTIDQVLPNLVSALRQKGFNVSVATDHTSFIAMLSSAHIAILISGHQAVPPELVPALVSFHNSGKGVYIWGDNAPYFTHANAVLTGLQSGIQLGGNTPGQKVLSLGPSTTTGRFAQHLITTGVARLYEGYTICHPVGAVPAPYQVLATSTDANPVILYKDAAISGTSTGRIVVDCAFTKLYMEWDTAGTARYVSNACGWLVGVEFEDVSF